MRWILPEKQDEDKVKLLSAKSGVPLPFATVLLSRGIDNPAQLYRFISPKLSQLTDPFLLPGLEKATERILLALRRKEKIGIFGDYDVDGLSSVALLYLVLLELGADMCWYIPSRLHDGYGLSKHGIKRLQAEGVSLIITVDCGVSDIESVKYASALGIDCIITDHHELPEELPPAYAIVNPKLPDAPDVTRELAGVGVAFKLAQGIYSALGLDGKGLYRHLDLVALGTAADIVPLVDENRTLVKFGLEQLARTRKPGLRTLIEMCGLAGSELSTSNIVFTLGPRLNSAGRIGSAYASLKLLTTFNYSLAKKIAKLLEADNEKRRKFDDETVLQAEKKLEMLNKDEWRKIIVLSDPNWHIGVIGIVASRLIDKYYRPTILITTRGGIGKGSARSINGFHILEAIKSCGDYLRRCGGHKHAAGLTIEPSQIENFKRAITRYAEKHLPDDLLEPTLEIDGYLTSSQLSIDLLKWVRYLAPYGPQNMRPVFLMDDVSLIGEPRLVGDNHLLFRVMGAKRAFDVIGFGFGEKITELRAKRDVKLAFVLENSTYSGREELKLRVKDMKFDGK